MDIIERNLKQHLRVLCDEIGSRSILEGHRLRRAQDYIHGQFAEMGLEIRVQDYQAQGTSTSNLIANLLDSDPAAPYLLVGAHYDTVPGTPGADDNASAVAVLLETARILAPAMHPTPAQVLFAAFSTEEPPSFSTGDMGSRVFIRSLPGMEISVEGALILEMVGFFSDQSGSQKIPLPLKLMNFPDTGHFIAIVGNGNSRPLIKRVSTGIRDSGCGLPVESLAVPGSGRLLPEVRLSDNASFWDAGIPAVMITDTPFFRNPHYHCPTDTPETLDFRKMAQLVLGLSHVLGG